MHTDGRDSGCAPTLATRPNKSAVNAMSKPGDRTEWQEMNDCTINHFCCKTKENAAFKAPFRSRTVQDEPSMQNRFERMSADAFSFPSTDLPGRSAQASPGGIRAQACSALCALLEFPQSRLGQPRRSSVSSSFPAQPSGLPAPPGHVR